MYNKKYKYFLIIFLLSKCLNSQDTILDDYINTIDPTTTYSLVTTQIEDDYSIYILDLNSQQWLTENEVDREFWQHWIILVIPEVIEYETSLLLIDGGSNSQNLPDLADEIMFIFSSIAVETKSVISILKTVPNEPLTFSDENFQRTEDEIIAYSWEKFLTTGDPKWPLQLPMTKSVVTSMDAIQDFCLSNLSSNIIISDFFITGGSKRGWTTWLSAAVDDRIKAISPIVFDALNITKSFRTHFGSYGEWSPAVNDYEEMGIFDMFYTEPLINNLMNIVDPYAYKDRLNMPKYIIAATGDEFFVPAAQFYINDLPGNNHLAYFPNTGHGFVGQDYNAIQNLTIFYKSILDNIEIPIYNWQKLDDGSIEIQCSESPVQVKMWEAINPNGRDFRDYIIGDAWVSTILEDQGDESYFAEAIYPQIGWKGMFIEILFDLGYEYPIMVTTDVSIFPDSLPFATDIIINLNDENSIFSNYYARGQLTSWQIIPFYNDGNNGDVVSNDHIWTTIISAISDGSYNWDVYGINAIGDTILISLNDTLNLDVMNQTIVGDTIYNVTMNQGDINNDGYMDITDIILLINMILNMNMDSIGDINGDEIVDILDIVQLVIIILN